MQKHGLKRHLNAFWVAFQNLSGGQKTTVRSAISGQNNLPRLFRNATPCLSADELPDEIKITANRLARYLFRQLIEIKDGDKNLRDTHFDFIHESGIRVCPFCGLQYFDPPGNRRNELDHIMAISKYPFVAANFRNLAPICNYCNSEKRDVDILVDQNGNRRRCSDPYFGPVFTVCLADSDVGDCTRTPLWEISLLPEVPEAATWDAVYKIKARYRAILNSSYSSWIQEFADWFAREIGKGQSPSAVSAELRRYICNVVQDGFNDRSFLKSEVFKFLDRSCADPNTGHEVQNFLRDAVENAT